MELRCGDILLTQCVSTTSLMPLSWFPVDVKHRRDPAANIFTEMTALPGRSPDFTHIMRRSEGKRLIVT